MISNLQYAVWAENKYSVRGGNIKGIANEYGLSDKKFRRFLRDLGYVYGKAPELKTPVVFEKDFPYLFT